MSLDLLCAVVLVVGLIAYAILAGADFGAGFWNAFAFGPRRREVREAMFHAMGPLWETNHVWLILVLVTLWTCFPTVFGALFIQLFVPLTVALVGIVFRGAAFAFRHYGGESEGGLPATGLVFSTASIVTPFAMGVCVGALAGGHLDVSSGETSAFEAWLRPFPLFSGVIGLTISAFLTPCYMLARPIGGLRREFRNMALASAIALGLVTTLALPLAAWDAPEFADHLLRPAPILLILASVVSGTSLLVLLWRHTYAFAHLLAGATAALVLIAWAAAQYPYIVMPDTRIDAVSSGDATLSAFLIALVVGALVVPAMLWLFSLFATAPAEAFDD